MRSNIYSALLIIVILTGGTVFWIMKNAKNSTSKVDFEAYPKPLKDDEQIKTEGWFGKQVMPKHDLSKLTFGNWVNGEQVSWIPYNLSCCTVREDRDNFLRVHDGRREGWVKKNDMVIADNAVVWWSQAFNDCPNDWNSFYMRRLSWIKKGEFDKAIAECDDIIKHDEKNSDAYYDRGFAYHEKKEYDKAIADFNEAIRLNVNNIQDIYVNRGRAWLDKKEYDRAIADYSESIRIEAFNSNAFENRGYAWFEKKEYEKAIADYNEAIRLDRNNFIVYFNRGYAWHEKKEYDKAIADYNEAIRLDKNNIDAYLYRGSVWIEKKEYERANSDFSTVISFDSKNEFAHTYLAHMFAKIKKYNEAVYNFNIALELNDSAHICNSYSWFLSTCLDDKFRNGKRSVELAKKAIDKIGTQTEWYNHGTLAAAYAESAEFDLAIAEQQKAIRMAKSDKNLDPKELKKSEARLELYRAKKPYRELD